MTSASATPADRAKGLLDDFQKGVRKLSRQEHANAMAKAVLRAIVVRGIIGAPLSDEEWGALTTTEQRALARFLQSELDQSFSDIVIPIGLLSVADPELFQAVFVEVDAIMAQTATKAEQLLERLGAKMAEARDKQRRN